MALTNGHEPKISYNETPDQTNDLDKRLMTTLDYVRKYNQHKKEVREKLPEELANGLSIFMGYDLSQILLDTWTNDKGYRPEQIVERAIFLAHEVGGKIMESKIYKIVREAGYDPVDKKFIYSHVNGNGELAASNS